MASDDALKDKSHTYTTQSETTRTESTLHPSKVSKSTIKRQSKVDDAEVSFVLQEKENSSKSGKMVTSKSDVSRITEGALHPSKVSKSTVKRQSKVDDADVSFVLQEKENSSKSGKIVTSKSKVSRITEGSEFQESVSVQKTSDELLREEIASCILDEIILRIENIDTSNRGSSHYFLKRESSHNKKSTINSTGPLDEATSESEVDIRIKQKNKIIDKNRKQPLSLVVRDLDLPINLSKSKPFVESLPRFERLVIDTHVVTSKTILSKPEESKMDSTLGDGVSKSTNEESPSISSPFELCWCFGFNPEVPVINLSTECSSKILFANSQFAVIYDFHEETMSFLQGHLNPVSCMSTNPKGNRLATADSGADGGTPRVIIWDNQPCVLQVLDNVHPQGCQQIALSANGEFLITVSANEIPVSIKVWEFEKDPTTPSASTTIKESLGSVKKLTAHPSSKSEFVVTFERSVIFAKVVWQVIFQESSEYGKATDTIQDCEFSISASVPHKIGALTDTKFLEDSKAIALSSSNKGYVVVWEDNINSKHKRTYSKYVRLHMDCITNIEIVDNKVAVATESGNVSFYDSELKILFFHRLHQEPLVSLSFNQSSLARQGVVTCEVHSSCANVWKKEKKQLVDASLKSEPFSARHYVVSTESGRIAYVNASSGVPKYLQFPSKEMFTALDFLPRSKYLAAGTASGKCILFDIEHRKMKVIQQIKTPPNLCQAVSFLKYSPSGYTLACGMYTGDVWLLDPLLLIPIVKSPLTDCNYCITELVFTSNTEYLIITDVSCCVTVYFLGERPTLIGQFIGHYKSIVSVNIDEHHLIDTRRSADKGTEIPFCTVSSDRSMCLFVIDREKNTLEFIFNQRVEQTATPMYSTYYPHPYSDSSELYLGVNDEYKFRMHDTVLASSPHLTVAKRCRGTFQAPDFGSPINYLETFQNNNNKYLFFKTKNHIGIHQLQIDGNPFRALGFRASPVDITCAKIDPEGKYVLTISESFGGINMWKINTEAVEDFYKSGGEGIEPFLKILGEEKTQEIRDFFDLGQFLHQGESPSLVRTLRNTLPICEVANVLHALGCILTKQDITELTNAWVTSYVDNPNYNIEYDDFILLYWNFRSRDLKIEDLRKAFRDFQLSDNDECELDVTSESDPVFDTATFMQKLLATGEEMTLEELYADLSILTGGKIEPSEEERLIFQVPTTMPKEISFDTIVKDILGFSPLDDTKSNTS